MRLILSKGDNLKHVREVGDMVKRDFRGHAKFFSQNIVLQARAATRLHTEESGRLYETFKIKTVAVNSKHNFLSDTSLRSLCR
jgi:hypothetical protein